MSITGSSVVLLKCRNRSFFSSGIYAYVLLIAFIDWNQSWWLQHLIDRRHRPRARSHQMASDAAWRHTGGDVIAGNAWGAGQGHLRPPPHHPPPPPPPVDQIRPFSTHLWRKHSFPDAVSQDTSIQDAGETGWHTGGLRSGPSIAADEITIQLAPK